MRSKSLNFIGLMVLTAVAAQAQPTNGPVYWSTTSPDCSSLNETAVTITDQTGRTIGYSCYVSGTFVWLAAGGGWGTSIRTAAPASAPVGADYSFYDTSGNPLSMDLTGAYAGSTNDLTFALAANQPSEVDLAGATSTAPNYSSTTTGSAYVIFYCPDANTCWNVLPQLIYSNLPSNPWSLSVPIAWDDNLGTQYSAEGIDDGGGRRVSLAIYNEDLTATSYTVDVFDSGGNLVGSGMTPSIPPLQNLGNGEGGTYGFLLSDVVKTPLPSGVFKILVDGGSIYSAVEVLQFTGSSATTLQVAFDSAPSTSTTGSTTAAIARGSRSGTVPHFNPRKAQIESTAKPVFRAAPR